MPADQFAGSLEYARTPGCGLDRRRALPSRSALGYGVARDCIPSRTRAARLGFRHRTQADDRRAALIELIELDRDECLRLVAATSGRVGRIAVGVPDSPPIVRPVNYVFDDRSESVAFRSGSGPKLRSVIEAGSAVFEIDGGDAFERTGWSVIIVGEAEEVTDPDEIDRLEQLELASWAPGAKIHWVRVRARSASGRRIVRMADAAADDCG